MALVLPLTLALVAPGCLAVGAGAAAVGGCALLDRDSDEVVTEEELSLGLFEAWDDDGDGRLSEAEFEAGVASREMFAAWSDDFADWDDDADGTLTEAEFVGGASSREEAAGWLDRQCDELGL
jgi:hypothetical protein